MKHTIKNLFYKIFFRKKEQEQLEIINKIFEKMKEQGRNEIF